MKWDHYKTGFGSAAGEYWLGTTESICLLTIMKKYDIVKLIFNSLRQCRHLSTGNLSDFIRNTANVIAKCLTGMFYRHGIHRDYVAIVLLDIFKVKSRAATNYFLSFSIKLLDSFSIHQLRIWSIKCEKH